MKELNYSKSLKFYLRSKGTFFDENESLLKEVHRVNSLYSTQPKRSSCKLCNHKLSQEVDFINHGIDYVFCSNCDHLNGLYQDTEKFTSDLYRDADGEAYSKNYIDDKFYDRVRDIYMPKLDNLLASLGTNPLKILDVGCGGGYFVAAALEKGISCVGVDISRSLTRFGNENIRGKFGVAPLSFYEEEEFYNVVKNSDANVISFIGVLEHLREPEKMFNAFKSSSAEYIYYSVPMYSPSVAFENVFQGVFPRHLSGGHTHLFTEKSVDFLNKSLEVESISEWRFGTDTMDLFRSIVTCFNKNHTSERFLSRFQKEYINVIDDLQAVLDRAHWCSEIHLVGKKV